VLEQGSQPLLLVFGKSLKQAGEWESFAVEKWDGFKCAHVGGCWRGEAGDRLAGSKTFYVISIFGFLWLFLMLEAGAKVTVDGHFYQVLTAFIRLLQRLWIRGFFFPFHFY
jgi:hypothetical protein